ncbi:hypothetical protein HK102_004594, partial [Quaeritorhiza haematococci]
MSSRKRARDNDASDLSSTADLLAHLAMTPSSPGGLLSSTNPGGLVTGARNAGGADGGDGFGDSDGEEIVDEFGVDDLPNEIPDDIDDVEEGDDEGEDLFGEDMDRDYRENERLDQYDIDNLDDGDYESMDAETRQLVEEKLRRRDREQARLEGRLPAAFMDDDEDDDDRPLIRRRRRRGRFGDDLDLGDLDGMGGVAEIPVEALQEPQGPFREWVVMEGPRQRIKQEFEHFLTS